MVQSHPGKARHSFKTKLLLFHPYSLRTMLEEAAVGNVYHFLTYSKTFINETKRQRGKEKWFGWNGRSWLYCLPRILDFGINLYQRLQQGLVAAADIKPSQTANLSLSAYPPFCQEMPFRDSG